ncbi:MAG: GAF domain-containing protein [Aquisalinus sp.]|nr:GAF domain-containing protein [Aquisalinus sp.]
MHQSWENEFRDRLPLSNTLIAAGLLVIMTILGGRFFVTSTPADAPVVESGRLTVADWDFDRGTIQLSGDWEFYWKQYLGEDRIPAKDQPDFGRVPDVWHNLDIDAVQQDLGDDDTARGYATYRLVIEDLEPGPYSVFIPILYAPSRIWVDGEQLTENGKLARDFKAGEEAIWKGHFAGFNTDDSDIEILIEVSDHIHGDGRFIVPPVFGPPDVISDYITVFNIRDLLIQGIATILFIFGIVLFLFRRSDFASLYFAIFALSFGTVLSYLGVSLPEVLMPGLDFWTKINIFYAAECAAVISAAAYIAALYPDERIRIVDRLIQIITVFFLIYVTIILAGKPDPFDFPQYAVFLLVIIPFTSLYILVTVIRAVLNNRDGAWIFLFSMLILVYCSIGEILVTNGTLPSIPAIGLGLGMTSLGFMIFLIAQVIVLAQRWTHTLQTSEKMTTDLSRLIEVTSAISSEMRLETLLGRIVHGATEFIHAERSTLFLYDERTDELWSLIAEGLENREIRMPANQGLAGACFQTGSTINVPDAYADSRFNQEWDVTNNFRTRNILTMAVEGKSGKRIGVMQVLNKIGGRFQTIDEERLHAFAAQAAIAIENAELFGEVISARNYNESILGSMSNGVVTINAYGNIEKINTAALEIFGGEEPDYIGTDANSWLAQDNAWLIEELATMRGEDVARTLLDVDVTIPDGGSKSLNISIVPLIDQDGDDNGTLMLVEDITGEKRLRGTMSRFMTKEVADKILDDGEDSLAGSTVNASVLFADLRGFTSLSEQLGARGTVAMLNEYFGEMTDAIFNWQGVLDKFIGDSIMAVYGAPIEGDRDADNALASAVEMKHILARLNEVRASRNEDPLNISVGIATGEVIAGTIGSAKRMEYTVIGDCVNVAARLENLTRYYGADIIASEDTLEHAKVSVMNRELDLIRVKGRARPGGIYEILGHHTAETFLNMEDVLHHYQSGLSAYRQRNWDQAIAEFASALKANETDRPSQIYLDRAKLFKENPPPDDWDGVWTMTSK